MDITTGSVGEEEGRAGGEGRREDENETCKATAPRRLLGVTPNDSTEAGISAASFCPRPCSLLGITLRHRQEPLSFRGERHYPKLGRLEHSQGQIRIWTLLTSKIPGLALRL